MSQEDKINQLVSQMEGMQLIIEKMRKEAGERLIKLESHANIGNDVTVYTDIVPNYTSPNDIKMTLFQSLPQFKGDIDEYRSWRKQVWNAMDNIKEHTAHNNYFEALGIVRTKITGPASHILINSDTKNNFYAIIDRLDFTYADQRPLYVLEAEMCGIEQRNLSLLEYHDKITQSLNLVISKIDMTYKNHEAATALIGEIKTKSVRTFIMGINNGFTKNTLYQHNPKSLSEAYAIASTIYHDNKYQKLEVSSKPMTRRDTQHFVPNATRYPQQHMQPQRKFESPQPMELGSSTYRRPFQNNNSQRQQYNDQRNNYYNPFRGHQNNQNNQYRNNNSYQHQNNQSDVKREADKRNRDDTQQSNNNHVPNKFQRVNHQVKEDLDDNISNYSAEEDLDTVYSEEHQFFHDTTDSLA